jgi:hypothetical protein
MRKALLMVAAGIAFYTSLGFLGGMVASAQGPRPVAKLLAGFVGCVAIGLAICIHLYRTRPRRLIRPCPACGFDFYTPTDQCPRCGARPEQPAANQL